MPKTRTHLTGSGGLHIIYRQPKGYDIGNTVRLAGYPGIDRRGNGEYIILPFSSHVSGGRYEIIDDAAIIEAPKALLELQGNASSSKSHSQSIPADIPEGTRNQTLTSLAGTMRRRGISLPIIESALREINKAQCKPPLSDNEVHSIAENIGRYEPIADNHNGNGEKQDESLKDQTITIKTVKMSTVKAEKVKFLWRPYIPLGKLTIEEGDPEAGKSWVALGSHLLCR